MPSATTQKLKIREGGIIRTMNAPKDYMDSLIPLPQGVTITTSGKKFNQLHWFVKTLAELEKEVDKVLEMVKGDVICWIFFPKGSSKMQTDLNRDNLWIELQQHELQFITLVAFNETWSAFGIRNKTSADKKKETKIKQREVFNYVDPVKKTVQLPVELEKAFRKNREALNFFNSLSFSNRKEYIEWIVSAKREETRNERINGTLERLGKGWKNPANR